MSWSREKLLAEFRASSVAAADLVERKNSDYAGGQAETDAFANFRLIEFLTSGRLSMEDGLLVRMSDKLARLASLSQREAAVCDESFADTCADLANYARLTGLARRSRTEPDEFQAAPEVTPEVTPEAPSAWEKLRALFKARGLGEEALGKALAAFEKKPGGPLGPVAS